MAKHDEFYSHTPFDQGVRGIGDHALRAPGTEMRDHKNNSFACGPPCAIAVHGR
jgi:hypothetical protein